MTIRCLIIDDEPLAHRILERYIEAVPNLQRVGNCTDAVSAMAFLHTHEVDLIFLDIQMPELSGLDFLRAMTVRPTVIITSAHASYALESYEFAVTDYLLKPIPFDRFLKAVNRAMLPSTRSMSDSGQRFVFVKSGKKRIKVLLADITHIQGCGNYVELHTIDRMILVNQTMTSLEKRLPAHLFVRSHRSHIVNVAWIKGIEGPMIVMESTTIPIGATHKKQVKNALEQFQLDRR